jgi:hypothetical protein
LILRHRGEHVSPWTSHLSSLDTFIDSWWVPHELISCLWHFYGVIPTGLFIDIESLWVYDIEMKIRCLWSMMHMHRYVIIVYFHYLRVFRVFLNWFLIFYSNEEMICKVLLANQSRIVSFWSHRPCAFTCFRYSTESKNGGNRSRFKKLGESTFEEDTQFRRRSKIKLKANKKSLKQLVIEEVFFCVGLNVKLPLCHLIKISLWVEKDPTCVSWLNPN